MSETALISTVVIVQFTVLAGLVLYLAQRIEGRIDRLDARIDRLEARFDARFERLEERLRMLELGQAKLVGRLFGDDPSEFESASDETAASLAGASAATA